jgi:hypothetical protein
MLLHLNVIAGLEIRAALSRGPLAASIGRPVAGNTGIVGHASDDGAGRRSFADAAAPKP